MNKKKLPKTKGQIVPNLAGSSNSGENDEMEPNSSDQNSGRSTRKRTIKRADDSLTEAAQTKRTRFDSSVADPTRSQISNSSKSFSTHKQIESADDLPPEMIDAILKHLTTSDLLRIRQVNRNWNELSTRILSYREDMELSFCFDNEQFVKKECTWKSLKQFVHCFRKSKLPFRHFGFGHLKHYGNKDISKFFSIEGKCILSLGVTMEDSQNDVDTLRKLLLADVPNLKKLKIEFVSSKEEVSSVVADPNKFQLPKLECLVVNHFYNSSIGDILTAASNLKRLEMTEDVRVKDLKLLQSLNKLHCLKAVKIYLSKDLIDYWSNSSTMNLKLEDLHLSFNSNGAIQQHPQHEQNEQLLRKTSIINQLLESSKDVIRTLAMEPIAALPGVVFPTLEKLYKLAILPGEGEDRDYLSLLDMAEFFPNLKELDYFSSDDLWFTSVVIPSVETLRIFCNEYIGLLTKMVPNVKTLFLYQNHPSSYHAYDIGDTLVNGMRHIFANLTKLETVEWQITESSFRKLKFTLDAAVTGLPEKFCEQNSVKFQKRSKLSSDEIASIEGERKNSSILDLKDLKKLNINFIFGVRGPCPGCGDEYCEGSYYDSDNYDSDSDDSHDSNSDEIDDAGFAHTSKFYETGFTKVSEFLAFKLIPNLELNITKKFD